MLVPQSTPTIHQEAKSRSEEKKTKKTKSRNPIHRVHKKDPSPQPTDHPIKKLREHITDSSRGYRNFDKKKKKRRII
jgi:hypothetical protein